MFRTSNPAFRNEPFGAAQTWGDLERQGRSAGIPGAGSADAAASAAREAVRAAAGVMTLQGTVNKTFFLLALCVGGSLLGWNSMVHWGYGGLPMLAGALGGFVVGLVCCIWPRSAPITAPIYAVLEGLFVGGISAVYAARFAAKPVGQGAMELNTGLVMNAALLTFGICGGLLVGYTTKLIRPGPVFRNAVMAGTIGVCLFLPIAWIASMCGAPSLLSVYNPSNGGVVSIAFSGLLVALASGNLVLDFETIAEGAANRAPKHMEWYGGFGLLVSLVWLYLEVLRLLAKLKGRD